MNNLDGTFLVGWLLVTFAFAGLYGAVKNETWFSVLRRTVKPSNTAVKIRP